MATLNSTQRRILESAVIKARKLSEQGAVKTLQNLAVDQAEPFPHMDADKRFLRNRLRAKGRLVGDEIRNGAQEIANLSYELAYEYWHKMLFARFLEANHLLIHPEHDVAVSLNECAEFALEEGHVDKWTAAASYASHMLPAIFRPGDPLMHVEFATEDRFALEQLLDGIEEEIFLASDSLGWVYQYWQTEAKVALNASGDMIDGKRLPIHSQLFTEPYMVHFLIDNTIGAWWVSRHPDIKPPVHFEYLRFLDDGKPAAGGFDGWPDATAEVTALDPCMGSGHFIIELFHVMASLRMHEENLSKEEATRMVIAENLHGLEIDPRCTQIAAFNLALTAWKFCGHYLQLPEMNLACSGIAPKGRKEDWLKLVNNVRDSVQRTRMENGMAVLYDHFQLAPELGSLLDPFTIKPDAFTASFDELHPLLLKALANEEDLDVKERGVMAAGIARAGEISARKYVLQITNVPYLSKGKQGSIIANFTAKFYPEAKGDLATVFLDNMLKNSSGTACSVILQNWTFLTSYKKFRESLLRKRSWCFIARLGTKGFQTPMWDFNVMLIAIHPVKPDDTLHFYGFDVSDFTSATSKDNALKLAEFKIFNQQEQLSNPDLRIIMDYNLAEDMLSNFAQSFHGQGSRDSKRFMLSWWEISTVDHGWILLQSTLTKTKEFGGAHFCLLWENGEGQLAQSVRANEAIGSVSPDWNAGTQCWGKPGVLISQTGDLPATLYLKSSFDSNSAVIQVNNESYLPALWCFCSSPLYHIEVRKIDQKLNVTNATLVKIPFDLNYWQKVANEKYPNGLPKPFSNDPTQWIFHGHPKISDNPIQIAIARLLGYHWPAENVKEMELANEARQYISQIKAFDHLADDDGIVCIPPVNGEKPAAERLRDYIKEVWSNDWGNNTIAELLKTEGSTKGNLEQWLRDEFFIQHCKVFLNRPFIWHIWDGRKDGFGALVNYHKLNQDRLKKLIYTYLNDWIRQCELKVKDGESGAEGLLMAARQLKEKLELILQGEPPYDIFVRWKPPHEQPIGWEPDLNDGVRLNIYPFIQAGVLRKNPTAIKWEKDRGKNPPESHWSEDRYNRYEHLPEKNKLRDGNGRVIEHLTNEVKQRERGIHMKR